MASSQSFYSNEEAYHTTLKILMETTADVYFIFEGNNNNSADFETDNGKSDDGVTKMDSQETIDYNVETVKCETGDGETHDDEMGGCETVGGEMNKNETGNGEASDSKTDGDAEEMDSQLTQALTQETVVVSQNETVKIPAHKQVLAELSPVFNAGMYNLYFNY